MGNMQAHQVNQVGCCGHARNQESGVVVALQRLVQTDHQLAVLAADLELIDAGGLLLFDRDCVVLVEHSAKGILTLSRVHVFVNRQHLLLDELHFR